MTKIIGRSNTKQAPQDIPWVSDWEVTEETDMKKWYFLDNALTTPTSLTYTN